MTKLKKFLKAIDHRIVEGAEFQWSCYGPDARMLDTRTEYGEASCVYDSITQFLYEVNAHDSLGRKESFRWVHKDYREVMKAEAKQRGLDHKEFLEGEKWSDTDSLEDMLDKVYGIINNRRFDHNVVMEFDLDEATLADLQRAALIRNQTVDDFIEDALRAVIEKEEAAVDITDDSAKMVGKKPKRRKKK